MTVGSPAAAPVPAAGSVALYDVDADTVAALVLGCPAVAGLSGGPYGAAATYLPGRRVAGVRIGADAVEVHVVARYGPAVNEVAAQIRRALSGHVAGRTVDIVVEDLADPEAPRPLLADRPVSDKAPAAVRISPLPDSAARPR